MPDLLDDRLRALIAPPDPEPALARLHGRARRRQNGRRALMGAAVALVVLAGTVALTRASDDTTDVHVGPPTTDEVEAGWSDLPMPPVVSISGAAWAGNQLVAWGPTEAGATEGHLFGLDQDTSTWEPLRPGHGVQATSAVWTGEQLVFLSAEATSVADTAPQALPAVAWTPATDEWTTVSRQPTPCAGSPTWTGEVIVTACPADGLDGTDVGTLDFHRLDLTDRTWSPTAVPPIPLGSPSAAAAIARIGDEVAAVGYVVGSYPTSFGALVYDPATDRWSELPGGDVPLAPSDPERTRGMSGLAATALEDDLLVVSADRTSARYLADERRWEQLGEIPTRGTICVPSVVLAGDTPVAELCSGIAALGPDGTWSTAGYPSGELYGLEGRWLAGDDAAVLVSSAALQRYRPPSPDVGGQIPFRSPVPLDDALLDVPDGAEVRSVEVVVVPNVVPNGGLLYEEQLQAAVVLADGAGCTITTGAASREDAGPEQVHVHDIEASLSRSAEGSTVRWSWTPGTAWHQVQVTCSTDAQALELAEHVRYPTLPDLPGPPPGPG